MAADHIPYWRQIFDRAGITLSVKNWEYEGSGTADDPYCVVWIDNDPRNPMNYSLTTKWVIAAIMGIECLGVTFCSSVFTGEIRALTEEFGCSVEVVILGLSLFVLGFAVGPLFWAPLSEMYGRQYIHMASFFGLSAFNAGAAASQNIWTLLILRFLGAAIGSSALVSSGAVLADVFTGRDRGFAAALYSLAPWLGPTLGPIVGGFVGETIGWRWVQGIMAIFTTIIWIAGSLLVPETYAPILLRHRAAKLSQISGKVYKSRQDIEGVGSANSTLWQLLKINLTRPWALLFKEPIVLFFSVYLAIVYGTLYMFFGAYPIVYQQNRGWSEGVGGLAFIGVLVGMILAVLPGCLLFQKRYATISDQKRGVVPPETRLPACMLGAIAAPIGLFWFAWTNGPSTHYMVSIVAGGVFGFGLVLVFSGSVNYIIDTYTLYAASAMAANSVLRSAFGAAFPLFTTQMFESLGIHWASSVPAFLALGCVPIPFVLYKYGPAIRQKGKYAAQSAALMDCVGNSRVRLNPDQDSSTSPQSEEVLVVAEKTSAAG